MAQGSNPSGGKSRRGSNGGKQNRGQTSGRGPAGGKSAAKSRQTAAAAQKAIQGARGRGKFIQVVLPILVVAAVAAAVVVGVVISQHKAENASHGLPANADTNSQVLANTANQSTGDPTPDGVKADQAEQTIFHIHAHLSIFINGKQKMIPYGVGIVPPYQLQQNQDGAFVSGGSKFYWMHVHDESGVVHIESPIQRTYTLGNFFSVWRQPLGPDQIGPDHGKVTALVNNKPYTGDPRNIPLNAHDLVQLMIGTPVPFQPFTFPQGE